MFHSNKDRKAHRQKSVKTMLEMVAHKKGKQKARLQQVITFFYEINEYRNIQILIIMLLFTDQEYTGQIEFSFLMFLNQYRDKFSFTYIFPEYPKFFTFSWVYKWNIRLKCVFAEQIYTAVLQIVKLEIKACVRYFLSNFYFFTK